MHNIKEHFYDKMSNFRFFSVIFIDFQFGLWYNTISFLTIPKQIIAKKYIKKK